jgi:hypothetical protein
MTHYSVDPVVNGRNGEGGSRIPIFPHLLNGEEVGASNGVSQPHDTVVFELFILSGSCMLHIGLSEHSGHLSTTVG